MKTLSQATLTAGDRTLLVCIDGISVFPAANSYRSKAAWLVGVSSGFEGKWWITPTDAFPAELAALVHGVLTAECPLQPLMDWVIEYGPANLAAEVEKLQAAILAAV